MYYSIVLDLVLDLVMSVTVSTNLIGIRLNCDFIAGAIYKLSKLSLITKLIIGTGERISCCNLSSKFNVQNLHQLFL